MLDSFTGILGATEQEGVGTGRSTLVVRSVSKARTFKECIRSHLGKFIDGEGLATSLLDAGASGSSEAKGGNAELRDFKEAASLSAKYWTFHICPTLHTGCRQ